MLRHTPKKADEEMKEELRTLIDMNRHLAQQKLKLITALQEDLATKWRFHMLNLDNQKN